MKDLYKYLRGMKYILINPSGQKGTQHSGGFAGYNYYFPTPAEWSAAIVTAESNWDHSADSASGATTPNAYYSKSWSPGPRGHHYLYVSIARNKVKYLYDWAGANYNPQMSNIDWKVYTIARLWNPDANSNTVMDSQNDFPNYSSTGKWFVVNESPLKSSGGNWVVLTNRIYLTNNEIGFTTPMPNACTTPNQPTNVYPQYQNKGYISEVKGVIAPVWNYCTDETLFTNSP
jgi:hypothetical protein